MTRFALLIGCLVVCAAGVPRPLSRAAWPSRFPRSALAVWMVLVATVSAAAVAAVLMTARHVLRHSAGGAVLRCCVEPLSSPALSRLVAIVCLAATVWGAAAVLHATAVAGSALRRLRRGWRGHVAALDVLARPIPGLAALVLEHAAPAAYCVPTGGGRVVITSGALSRLTPSEGAAVVEHERAHLLGRHHLLTAVTTSLARAFPHVPLFGLARPAVARLVELAADDRASRHCRSDVVVGALRVLAATTSAPTAQWPDDGRIHERIHRLVRIPTPRSWQAMTATAGFLAAIGPLPLITVWAWTGGC
ncbi:M56 family metallopeptidase [Streptomyces sp. cg40]|uniref:M56 family metallopeptidase n=1 Tax=Streptomyces sp. cg40 TaxID=3419764 RepID=UPI003D003525